jgi:hypothetical protein
MWIFSIVAPVPMAYARPEFTNIFDFANDEAYLVEANVNRDPSSPQFGQFEGTPRHFRWTQSLCKTTGRCVRT